MSHPDLERMRVKIEYLRRRLREDTTHPDTPEQARHIIDTAPHALERIERLLLGGDPSAAAQAAALLADVGQYIELAVGTARACETTEAIRDGRHTDPSLPAVDRLMNRLTRFVASRLVQERALALMRELCGDDAVQGTSVCMDMSWETEAFSLWLLHDVVPPGESRRLIDTFAEQEGRDLPDDERSLLQARLRDRPSFYKVVKLPQDRKTGARKATFLVQDLLYPEEVIRITDRSCSRVLRKGVVFIGRASPISDIERRYELLGTITEIPPPQWQQLAAKLQVWTEEAAGDHSTATARDIFRQRHVQILREIGRLTDR